MLKFDLRSLTLVALLACLAGAASLSFAQSSTQGSSSSSSDIAMGGYCPVCLLNMNKWMRGNRAYSAKFDGQTYYFPGAKQRDMFLADPAKYVPALGGDCVACYAKMGKRVPGSLNFATYYKKRLFLFPSDDQRKVFRENPDAFVNVDLALNGNCSVGLVEMKKEMPGQEEFATVHNGLRYLFSGEKQKEMFLANPAKYQVGGPVPAQVANNDSSNTPGPLAMGGYCAVCVKEMKKWVKGSPNHTVDYDGQTYYFPGLKQKEMFLANPIKYAPVMNGDCVVCLAKMGKRMPGSVRNAVYHRDRLYLFPGQEQKEMFKTDPEAYTKVDLAMGGNCAVCQVEMNKEMPGKPEFTVVYQGLRYLFPGEKQREMFLKNPEKYRVKSSTAHPGPPGKQVTDGQSFLKSANLLKEK